MPDPKLATSTTLAALLGVSRSTVLRWSEAGRIPRPILFGSIRRWVVDDVVDALREQQGAGVA